MLQGEAKTLFRQWQETIEHPTPIEAPAPVGQTFDAIAKTYITDYAEHPDRRLAAHKEMTRQVNVLRATFGMHAIASITKVMIEDFRTARRQACENGKAALAQVAALTAAGEPIPPSCSSRRNAPRSARRRAGYPQIDSWPDSGISTSGPSNAI